MANILFANKRRGKIGSLELDAILEEQHSFSSEVSQYPIETGESISDHIALNPESVMMRGFITNTPVDFINALTDLAFGADLVQTAFDKLIEIWKSKEVVTVVSGLKVYDNVVLRKLSIPRDRTTGQSLRFKAEFVEMITTNSSLTDDNIPTSNISPDEDFQNMAPSDINIGQQAATPASSLMTDRIASLQ